MLASFAPGVQKPAEKGTSMCAKLNHLAKRELKCLELLSKLNADHEDHSNTKTNKDLHASVADATILAQDFLILRGLRRRPNAARHAAKDSNIG